MQRQYLLLSDHGSAFEQCPPRFFFAAPVAERTATKPSSIIKQTTRKTEKKKKRAMHVPSSHKFGFSMGFSELPPQEKKKKKKKAQHKQKAKPNPTQQRQRKLKKKKNIKNRMKNRMFSHYVSCFIAFCLRLHTAATLSLRSLLSKPSALTAAFSFSLLLLLLLQRRCLNFSIATSMGGWRHHARGAPNKRRFEAAADKMQSM